MSQFFQRLVVSEEHKGVAHEVHGKVLHSPESRVGRHVVLFRSQDLAIGVSKAVMLTLVICLGEDGSHTSSFCVIAQAGIHD